jgi:hypothetical protein
MIGNQTAIHFDASSMPNTRADRFSIIFKGLAARVLHEANELVVEFCLREASVRSSSGFGKAQDRKGHFVAFLGDDQ